MSQVLTFVKSGELHRYSDYLVVIYVGNEGKNSSLNLVIKASFSKETLLISL